VTPRPAARPTLRRAAARRPAPDDGFTLVELLVVVIVIAILSAVAVPVYLNARSKAIDAAVKSDLKTLTNHFTSAIMEGAEPADLILAVMLDDGDFAHPSYIYAADDAGIRSGERGRVRYALCDLSRLRAGTTGAAAAEDWCDLLGEPATAGVYPMNSSVEASVQAAIVPGGGGASEVSWCVNLRYGTKSSTASYYDTTGAHVFRYTPEHGVEAGACRAYWSW
jgi:prepilin-type N-terminal cleavage/methylation domain-containing protein